MILSYSFVIIAERDPASGTVSDLSGPRHITYFIIQVIGYNTWTLSLLHSIQRADDLYICRSAKVEKTFKLCTVQSNISCISWSCDGVCFPYPTIPVYADIWYVGVGCGPTIAKFLLNSFLVPRISSCRIWFVSLIEMFTRARIFSRKEYNIYDICNFIGFKPCWLRIFFPITLCWIKAGRWFIIGAVKKVWKTTNISWSVSYTFCPRSTFPSPISCS